MGFASPWFLAGLAAVGLPVWFHLLKKHKSTPLPFSSLMFFERRTQSSIKHRRLQYLLLFALRTLLFVMLAVTFAGLFITGKPAAGRGDGILTVLAIDDSFSMRQGGRMERARREADQLLARMGPGAEAMVIAFAGPTRVIAGRTSDRNAVRAAVAAIEPSDSRASLGDLARVLRSIAESSKLPLEIHLFSDMQKSALPPVFADLQLPEGSKLVPHRVADGSVANWTVESVNAPRHLNGKSPVRATIIGFGTERADLRVSLLVNNKTLETKSVAAPGSGRVSVEFASLEAPYGLSRAEVRLDSGDGFPADDHFFFPVERMEARPVLLVHEARDTRSPLYFQAALEAGTRKAFSLDVRAVERVSGIDPANYAFTVLSNVGSIPGEFEEALARHVRAGGAALVALGPASSLRATAPFANAAILDSRGVGRDNRFQTVSWIDQAHPSLGGTGRWEAVKFYRWVRIDPRGAQILARLSGEAPLLVESAVGAGRVLVFTSTFDNISNDFPLHPSFVPFVQQMARYLSGLEDRPGALVVDSFLKFRESRDADTSVQVIDPRGQRALDLAEGSSSQGIPLRQEGFYEVRRGSGEKELVSANPDRRESDLAVIPEETMSLWQNTGQGEAAVAGGSEMRTQRSSLWWHAMVVVLLLALAESFVANQYLGARKGAA